MIGLSGSGLRQGHSDGELLDEIVDARAHGIPSRQVEMVT